MPAVFEHHLPNGLTLLISRQPQLHGIRMGLYLRGGSLYEDRETQGISHLLEHLCFRGIGPMDHDGLERFQSEVGMTLEGATYPEAVVFTMGCLPRFYERLLHLFHGFFEGRVWTEREIALEKQVVLRQIEEEEPDFDDEAELRFRATQAGSFPVMGTEESVLAMSGETIRLWQGLLFQPQNACLCISGPLSKGQEAAAIAIFSDLTNTTEEPPFDQPLPGDFCMRDASADVVTTQEGGLASVHLGFDINPERVFPVMDDILNAITAGGTDSLLFQKLREELALVPDIHSYIEETGMYRRLVIRWDVRQEWLSRSLRQVFTLLKRLCIYIRPVRMELSRMQFTDNLVLLEDDAEGMNELMGWSWVSDDMAHCDL